MIKILQIKSTKTWCSLECSIFLKGCLILEIKNNNSFIFINIILPIFIGGMIYILFRSQKLWLFHWFYALNLGEIINYMRSSVQEVKNFIPKTILFSLPDALWVYSFTMFISLFFKNFLYSFIYIHNEYAYRNFTVVFCNSTFDIYDLIYMFLFYLLSIYVLKKERRLWRKRFF